MCLLSFPFPGDLTPNRECLRTGFDTAATLTENFTGISVGEDTSILSYNDASKVSNYAVFSMQQVCGFSFISGSSGADGTGMVLNPKNNTTRAQTAVVLMRFDPQMN